MNEFVALTSGLRLTMRAELAESYTPVAELSRRVLARTTRENLGWREDLRLIGDFVRQRLRSSGWARVAAASLLLHFAALPVLAWMVLVPAGERGFQTGILPPAESPPRVREEPRWEPEPVPFAPEKSPPPAAADSEREVLTGPTTEFNALRWARWHLEHGGAPRVEEPPTTRIGVLLARRGAWIARGETREPTPALVDSTRDSLEQVLEFELVLDAHVLNPRAPFEVGTVVDAWLAGPEVERNVSVMQLAALLRAEAYGLLSQDRSERLHALARTAHEGSSLGGLEDPLRAGAPLDRRWIEALAAALPPDAEQDPVVAAWLRWRR
jgi:hypothetical protein